MIHVFSDKAKFHDKVEIVHFNPITKFFTLKKIII